MTLGSLRKLVLGWQRKLAPLGVSHWNLVGLEIVETDEFHASAHTSSLYDEVRLKFSKEFLEDSTQRQIETTIIHEWLHVAWRDHDAVESDVLDFLSPDVAKLSRDRFNHEREGLIQRIADLIFVVHSSSDVP